MRFDRVELRDIATVVMGISPKSDNVIKAKRGLPLLNGPTEFGMFSPTPRQWAEKWSREATAGDILLCVRGSTTGRINVADQVYAIGRGIAAIRGATDTDTRFIKYALLEGMDRLLSLTSGSVFPNLSADDIRGFNLSWPDKWERDGIATTLGALDDKIESNRRATTIGEALVRAHVESAISSSEGKLGPLGDYFTLVKAPMKIGDITVDANYIGLEHMPRGSIFLTEWKNAEGLRSAKTTFQRGDILFGKLRPYFKKVGIAPVNGVCSTDILVLRPNDPRDTALIASIAASDALIDSLSASSTGTRMPRSSWKDIAAWQIPILTPIERVKLSELVSPLTIRLEQLTFETRLLGTLRDSLLPGLLSGRIRVPIEKVSP